MIVLSRVTKSFYPHHGPPRMALNDVSLVIPDGDVVSIMGPNGAGKSTLLRVIMGTVIPDAGDIWVRGKIGALIDLTAGFHPDLTGWQNLIVNGMLQGMSYAESKRKAPAILEYGGLTDVARDQVKHYSQGMVLRLAFALAVHLDVDILLIDEALAVGDQEFQKKCLETLRRYAETGRTIVVVTHIPYHADALGCRRVYMRDGRLSATQEEVCQRSP